MEYVAIDVNLTLLRRNSPLSAGEIQDKNP